MRVEKGKVRAPEIGRVWLNSPPLSLRQLRGRVVLVDFWDYTCVNCIRTLPYVQAWHERYVGKGLTVIGVHTPEFTFAQYESNVERGVREFGLTYPIVIDTDREIWKAFANRYWPTKYLLDKEGYLRFAHFGEGEYRETEEAIRELLKEVNPTLAFPPLMEPLRAEDRTGAVCYRASPELYLGHRPRPNRQRLADSGKIRSPTIPSREVRRQLSSTPAGRWASTAEYLEAVEDGEHMIVLQYEAAGVNLVMARHAAALCDVTIRQDGNPLTPSQETRDTRFRSIEGGEAKLHLRAAMRACMRWWRITISDLIGSS